MKFPELLNNRLWHTTKIERFQQIVKCGYILAEPAIEDKYRWKTRNGPENYPFVRTLGGISVFEFNEFNPDNYAKLYPISSWHTFVPYRKDWGVSLWIEIDKEKIDNHFMNGESVLQLWREREAQCHPIMPIIEAAYLSALPVTMFKQVLVSTSDCPDLKPYESDQ